MERLFEVDSEDNNFYDDYGSDTIYDNTVEDVEGEDGQYEEVSMIDTLGEGKKVDKIFDNNFGNSEYEGGTISFNVDPTYHTYSSHDDEMDNRLLFEEIHKLIEISEYAAYNTIDHQNKAKKLSKLQINKVYTYVTVNVSTNYRKIDIFSILSDYFDIYPNKFYSSLSNKYKNELIMELDKFTNILEKRKIRRLF